MTYRLAKSLDTLRSQFNAHAPSRSKASDGWIGDAAHASTASDHNPWVKDGKTGIVTALDVTHDPKNGVDTYHFAEQLRLSKDPRVKYVISNGRIFSSTVSPWTWRAYTGSNPHSKHVHVSVNSTKAHYDDAGDWRIFGHAPPPSAGAATPDAPRPVLRRGARGEAVRTVQRLLVVNVDGDFGPITEQAVKDFQKKRDILVDGVVGPQTWRELDLIEQIPLPYESEPRQLSERLEPAGEASPASSPPAPPSPSQASHA